MKVEVPEIEGPKVVKKIDLDAIDSSTRPKKTAKAKKEEPAPVVEKAEPKAKSKKSKKEEEEDAKVVAETTPQPEVKEEQAVIENIEVEKLTGPKILGKIDLPVDSDTRPVKDEKTKRKRIPLAKKDVKREIF